MKTIEAVTEEIRTREDIEVARRLGEAFGERLRNWPESSGFFGYRLLSPQGGPYQESRRLFRQLLALLQAADRTPEMDRASWLRFAASEAALDLLCDLDDGLRLVSYCRSLRPGGGIAVSTERDEVYGCAPLFDLLNPRARTAAFVSAHGEDTPESWGDYSAGYLAVWMNRASGPDGPVRFVDQRTAMSGFMTLFADGVRSVARFFKGPGSDYVEFTVKANKGGYQVWYHPKYNVSPEVFGSENTPRVTARIRIGHYRFLGLQESSFIKDPGTYFASPWNREARVTAF